MSDSLIIEHIRAIRQDMAEIKQDMKDVKKDVKDLQKEQFIQVGKKSSVVAAVVSGVVTLVTSAAVAFWGK